MSRRWRNPGRLTPGVPALLLGALTLAACPLPVPADDPATTVAQALRGLGAPGLVWGRLAVEEESPDGPWTPLIGVDVRLLPYLPGLAADLDRIREGARSSGRDYDTAMTRIQERLRAFEVQVALAAEAGSFPKASDGGPVRKQTTDAAGVFVLDEVPSGDWLLVALHVSPYRQAREPSSARKPIAKRKGGGFLPRSPTTAKEAELWVSRVRVEPGGRTRVLLTDRSRFMVGPIH